MSNSASLPRLLLPLAILICLLAVIVLRSDPEIDSSNAPSQQSSTTNEVLEATPGLSEQHGDLQAADSIERTERGAIPPNAPGALGADSSSAAEVVITVVDGNHKPLPYAKVYVVDTTNSRAKTYAEYARSNALEGAFAAICTPYLTEANGKVSIPKPTGSFILAGGTDRHFGSPFQVSMVDSRITLVLELMWTVPVRVVDTNGAPVANAPVLLTESARPVLQGFVSATTNADGFAWIKRSFGVPTSVGTKANLSVTLNILSETPISVPVDLDNLPSEAIILVKPPTGQVEVIVFNDRGQPKNGESLILLSSLSKRTDGVSDWSESRSPLIQRTKDGRAFFPHVGLGMLLRAKVSSEDYIENPFEDKPGPNREGEVITISVTPKAGRAILVGRILNTEGQVAKNLQLQTRFRHYKQGSMRTERGLSLLTDEGGFFQMVVPEPFRAGMERALTITMPATKRKPMRSVNVDLGFRLPAGEHNLGDLVVDEAPILFEGRVVDGFGQPIAAVQVEVEREEFNSRSRAYWDRIKYWRGYSREDGVFEIRGYPEGGRLRLSAKRKNYADVAQEVRSGDRRVELVMNKSIHVNGRILLDPEIDNTSLFARIYIPNPAFPNNPIEQSVHVTSDGSYSFGQRPQGPARILVRSAAFREELYVDQQIQLYSDTGTITLPDIDLRGLAPLALDVPVVAPRRAPRLR